MKVHVLDHTQSVWTTWLHEDVSPILILIFVFTSLTLVFVGVLLYQFGWFPSWMSAFRGLPWETTKRFLTLLLVGIQTISRLVDCCLSCCFFVEEEEGENDLDSDDDQQVIQDHAVLAQPKSQPDQPRRSRRTVKTRTFRFGRYLRQNKHKLF